ncbi:MAG: iron-containing alcohol dehydrogenase, partial [Ferrovibrionaceae bacterium]
YIGLAPSFDAFLAWILDLRKTVGVPHTLDGINVGGEKAELIAEMAEVDPTAGGNPIKLTREGARQIFDAALAGRV